VFLVGINCDITQGKTCPKINVVDKFDASKYVGKWYEIMRLPNMAQFKERCVTSTFTMKGKGKMRVWDEKIDTDTDEPMNYEGEAFMDKKEPGKMGIWTGKSPIPLDYWVVDTDYVNYSVVHTCYLFKGFKYEYVWIYSKKPQLDAKLTKSITERLQGKGVEVSHLISTDQQNCTHQ
jgi:apolipoprotein D and lipocalin family protein